MWGIRASRARQRGDMFGGDRRLTDARTQDSRTADTRGGTPAMVFPESTITASPQTMVFPESTITASQDGVESIFPRNSVLDRMRTVGFIDTPSRSARRTEIASRESQARTLRAVTRDSGEEVFGFFTGFDSIGDSVAEELFGAWY